MFDKEKMRFILLFCSVLCFAAGCSRPHVDRGQANHATQMAICSGIADYRDKVGEFPKSLSDLIDKGNRSFLKVDYIPNDPWGNPYRYEVTEQKARITSDGPDKMAGTQDDVYREVSIGIGSPIAEAPSLPTGRTDRVSGESAGTYSELSK